jgi:O-antigen/teichoic acid export membrane protein
VSRNRHRDERPEGKGLAESEPVGVAGAVHAVLVAAVALGWATLDDGAIAAVVSAVASITGLAATWWARRRVTPITRAAEQ